MENSSQLSDFGHRGKLGRKHDVVNLNYILSLALRYWYLFVLSLPLALAWVYVSLMVAIPQYQSSCTMVVKNPEGRTPSGSYLIEGVGLLPEDKNLENQTFIMKSLGLSRRTINRLDFDIEYYTDGRFKDEELYHQSPFAVHIDSTVPHLLDVPVGLVFLGNGKVKVSINTEGANLYRLDSKNVVGALGALVFDEVVNVGDTVSGVFGSFVVKILSDQAYKGEYFFKLRSADHIAAEYRSHLNVSPYSEGSSILMVSLTGSIPAKLTRFLNEFCKVVIEKNLEQKNEIANSSLVFIQSQLQNIADTLDKTQDVLLSLKNEYGFRSPLAASEQMTDEYLEVEKEKKMLALKRDYFVLIKGKLLSDPLSSDFMLPMFTDNSDNAVSRMIGEIITVNSDLEMAKLEGGESNPYLVGLIEKSGQLRKELLLTIEKLLESIALSNDALNAQIKQYEAGLTTFPELEKRYLGIDRKYKLNDAIYTFLLQKNSEMQISKASNTPNNEVIDQASVSGPISPNPKKSYQKALLLGLVLPIAIIALIEFLNVRIRTKEELEGLAPNTPLLGIIPHGKETGRQILVENPQSAIAESFRTIRTRLHFMAGLGQSNVFTITSTDTGDGKTFVSVNLATAFALAGKKTIVLGFDLRKPRLNDAFNLNQQKGISNHLIGEVDAESICYGTNIKNLFVMPSGAIPPNPSELIGTQATASLFEWLKECFEVIVVDSPPIGVVSDARILMQYAHTHLFIVRSNYTRKDHLQLTLDGLIEEKVTGVGLVFNDVEIGAKGGGSYYSGYYHSNEL